MAVPSTRSHPGSTTSWEDINPLLTTATSHLSAAGVWSCDPHT